MSQTYLALFEINENCVSVSFPDLPGCIASGNTVGEAIEMAKEALEEFIRDENFSSKMSLEDIPELSNNSFFVPIRSNISGPLNKLKDMLELLIDLIPPNKLYDFAWNDDLVLDLINSKYKEINQSNLNLLLRNIKYRCAVSADSMSVLHNLMVDLFETLGENQSKELLKNKRKLKETIDEFFGNIDIIDLDYLYQVFKELVTGE